MADSKVHRISTPLTDAVISQIRAGDQVLISGRIYTARDAAHKRMVEQLERGEALPFDLAGQVIYYVGPTPPKPGQVLGSAGPTTSYRMDKYTPPMLARGIKAVIGKGYRNQEVKDALVQYKGLYLVSTGGTGALLAKRITAARVVAYEDLLAEAVRELEVVDFPTICIHDIYGGDQYAEGQKVWQRA